MRYYIKQKIFSLKDRYTVKDESGNDLFLIEEKMFSLSNKLYLQSLDGEVLYYAKKKIFSFLGHYYIFNKHDELIVDVKRKFGFRPKLDLQIGNQILTVQGSMFAHSFEVLQEGELVASISKKILSFGDSYEINVPTEEDKELYMFVVIIIDQMMHEKKRGSNH